jgi:hypothetical protein
MTPEEIERNIAFIVEHQAKFYSDIERINETLARHNEAIAGLIRISQSLLDHQTAMESRQKAADAQMTELRTEMKDLARAQKGTDQRLNVLIDVVEKHISGHDHGGPAPF